MSLRIVAGGADRRFDIVYDGARIPARAGESVAAALLAAGHVALRRAKDGSRRGIFCGMGVCQECLVTIDGVPGHRACMTAVRPGLVVASQAYAPAVPRPDSAPDRAAPRAPLSRDVVVIGAGAAGLSAACAAARAGASVAVLDERSEPGGQYYKQAAASLDARALDRQMAAGARLVATARAAGAEVVSDATAWGAFRLADGGIEIAALVRGRSELFHARALVLATGAYERGVPVPGWTLPGAMTTGAAQTMLRAYRTLPGRRILVAGNGPLNFQLAAELLASGAEVAAVAELARPFGARAAHLRMAMASPGLVRDGIGYLLRLKRRGVPVLTAHMLTRIEGDDRVRRAVLVAVTRDGHPIEGRERAFDADVICMGYGFEPQSDLARMLGCRHGWDKRHGQLAAVRDRAMATSVPGVFIAGDGGGLGGAQAAAAEGTIAGIAASRASGRAIGGALAAEEARADQALARARSFQAALWTAFRAPPIGLAIASPDTIVCRCEDVTRGELDRAFDGAAHDVGAVKRLTRAGMGRCQGRYCGPLIARALAERSGTTPDDTWTFISRPPAKPMRLGAVARKEFE
ncbi:MAG: FAD-dependent oxidoreductase [Alphaproteobacteria bacterium]